MEVTKKQEIYRVNLPPVISTQAPEAAEGPG